jgi:hypothetical protein
MNKNARKYVDKGSKGESLPHVQLCLQIGERKDKPIWPKYRCPGAMLLKNVYEDANWILHFPAITSDHILVCLLLGSFHVGVY